jgi:hypothetical protein
MCHYIGNIFEQEKLAFGDLARITKIYVFYDINKSVGILKNILIRTFL